MSEHKGKIIIYTDGGSRGNPGPAAIGVYVKTLDKKYGVTIGTATNNDAEYQAVIFALKKIKQLVGSENAAQTSVEIRSDSQLIVNQLSGMFKLKEQSLWKYFIDIWNRKQDFASVAFAYVPREENSVADAMVNQALDEARGQERALF
ncbi:MAG: ribonuclease HI family protein [Candidatus Paceibacterota bacterium]|jgi:ribonuclease HI